MDLSSLQETVTIVVRLGINMHNSRSCIVGPTKLSSQVARGNNSPKIKEKKSELYDFFGINTSASSTGSGAGTA